MRLGLCVVEQKTWTQDRVGLALSWGPLTGCKRKPSLIAGLQQNNLHCLLVFLGVLTPVKGQGSWQDLSRSAISYQLKSETFWQAPCCGYNPAIPQFRAIVSSSSHFKGSLLLWWAAGTKLARPSSWARWVDNLFHVHSTRGETLQSPYPFPTRGSKPFEQNKSCRLKPLPLEGHQPPFYSPVPLLPSGWLFCIRSLFRPSLAALHAAVEA